MKRVEQPCLLSLECQRLRDDLIEVYRITRGMDGMDSQNLFPRVDMSIARGHRFKVKGGKFKGGVRSEFLTQRVISAWNALPEELVEADTIAMFKRHLDRYVNRQGIEGYGPCRCKRFLV